MVKTPLMRAARRGLRCEAGRDDSERPPHQGRQGRAERSTAHHACAPGWLGSVVVGLPELCARARRCGIVASQAGRLSPRAFASADPSERLMAGVARGGGGSGHRVVPVPVRPAAVVRQVPPGHQFDLCPPRWMGCCASGVPSVPGLSTQWRRSLLEEL